MTHVYKRIKGRLVLVEIIPSKPKNKLAFLFKSLEDIYAKSGNLSRLKT